MFCQNWPHMFTKQIVSFSRKKLSCQQILLYCFWRLRLKKEQKSKKLFKNQSSLMFFHKNRLLWFLNKYFTAFCSSFPFKITHGRWKDMCLIHHPIIKNAFYLFLIWHTGKWVLHTFYTTFSWEKNCWECAESSVYFCDSFSTLEWNEMRILGPNSFGWYHWVLNRRQVSTVQGTRLT